MDSKKEVLCENLTNHGYCKEIDEVQYGRITRENARERFKYCQNNIKNSCCYLCSMQHFCSVNCNYLIERPHALISPKLLGSSFSDSITSFPKQKPIVLPSKSPGRWETGIGLFIGGLIAIIAGYLLTQSAYQYSGFYYGRYYVGIFGIIAGAIMIFLAIVAFVFGSSRKRRVTKNDL